MRRSAAELYRCPYTGEPLAVEIDTADGSHVISGQLVATSGRVYRIDDGIPFLLDLQQESLSVEERKENDYYQASSQSYDAIMDWVYKSFYEDEETVRSKVIDLLELSPTSRVLETGAGTCRDSAHILRRLGPDGELYAQDLSPEMLTLGRKRVEESKTGRGPRPRTEFFVGNAAHLPFPDRCFDAAFHFGGINLFTDRRAAIAEMARVVCVGGKVVFGDEGVAPWLRQTLHGEILMNSNKLYRFEPPTEFLPESARDAAVRWFLGNAYYMVDFRVGDGPPRLDLDLPIVGRRGGTHRTRYYGALEGVTVQAKALAEKAARDSGLTLHEWLDRAVRAAAAGQAERT